MNEKLTLVPRSSLRAMSCSEHALSPAAELAAIDRETASFAYLCMQNTASLVLTAESLTKIAPEGEQYYRMILNGYALSVKEKMRRLI